MNPASTKQRDVHADRSERKKLEDKDKENILKAPRKK